MENRVFDGMSVQEGVRMLKRHLRITSCDLDWDLGQKFLAAVLSAEHWIGSDILLSSVTTEVPFVRSVRLRRPPIEVSGVAVDGALLQAGEWALSGNTLAISEGVSGVTLTVNYLSGMHPVPEDLMQAVLLKAGALFANPADSVDLLQTASMNLLRPYRKYE